MGPDCRLPRPRRAQTVTPRGSPHARAIGVALLALVPLAAWEASGWDRAVARWYGGPTGFAWRDAWWASALLHDGGRVLGVAALILLALYALAPRIRAPLRRERLYWLAVTLACALLVPGLKRLSATSCPWDMVEFGGVANYVPHWLPGIVDGGPGRCFPSGHAVSAFGFFGLHFLWQRHDPRLARAALIAVLVAGTLFAWTQTVRGAHYPSHAMWSAWLCWALCALAAWLRDALPAGRVQSNSSDTVAK